MNRKQFSKKFSAHVVSLARTPERLRVFQEWNRAADIDIEIFPAVDGRLLEPAGVDPQVLKPGVETYKRGSIGSALSHHALWTRCAAGEKPFLVFEDDAAIRGDIRQVLPDLVDGLASGWDFLSLGYNTDVSSLVDIGFGLRLQFGFPEGSLTNARMAPFTQSRPRVGVCRLLHQFGLCGYLLSSQGAKKMLGLCFPLDDRPVWVEHAGMHMPPHTLDTRMNSIYSVIGAFTCIPPLVLPTNDPNASAK